RLERVGWLRRRALFLDNIFRRTRRVRRPRGTTFRIALRSSFGLSVGLAPSSARAVSACELAPGLSCG
ncbi:MAG TPA: hypothetical protein VGJ84_17855, partial [Polyangiaceae bacterium]